MKAIILAAGYATRLYPLTLNTPKPLLPIAGKPLMEYIVDKIEEVPEVTEIYIVTNDKFYSHFLDWLNSYDTKKPIKIINDNTKSNDDRLGAVGDIHFVVDKEKIDEDTLVIAGDNLFEFSLIDFVKFFEIEKKSVVACYDMHDKEKIANKFGVVILDNESRIVDFEEKPSQPKSTLISTACYLFSKEDIEEFEKCIKENHKPDNTGDFIKHLASQKHVYAYVFDHGWFDIGSKEHLEDAEKYYRKNI